jgi:transcriptional regulator with PAS, ATPase and Fis domain
MQIEEIQKQFGIIGKSKEIRDLIDIINQVAPSDISILIYGESGVGKEVFAKAIHGLSKRASSSIISVNCGAIPEGILESELFGHKKGSFTGASESRKGYFELADGGTLFLDEIAEMPISTQVKLLRAIESKEFIKVGAETVTKVDVRFIAATNKDLQNEVAAKKFREDLYFRLKAVSIEIPPLRKRKIDIEELTYFFLNSFISNNKTDPIKIDYSAIDLLKDYSWPGNVRELKNTIETAAALCRNGILSKENILPLLSFPVNEEVNRNVPVPLRKSAEDLERDFIYRALFELKRDILELKEILLEKNYEVASKMGTEKDIIPVEEMEKKAILDALEKTKFNKRLAAKLLNINERTFYRKLEKYNIE